MSLIVCSECRRQISSLATACPTCGCPREAMSPSVHQPLSQPVAVDLADNIAKQEIENLAKFSRPKSPAANRSNRNTMILFVVVLLFTVGIGGASLVYLHQSHERAAQAQAQAREEQERRESERVVGEALLLESKRKRLEAAKARLAKMLTANYFTIVARRQFGVDEETGLAEWEAGVPLMPAAVLLAAPEDLSYGSPKSNVKIAKIDRRQVSVTHTSGNTGIQTESSEYADVYLAVTAERIEALKKDIAAMEQELQR